MERDDQISAALVKDVEHRLYDECLSRIKKCLDMLSEDQIWWRPNPESNSIGNLVLHLSGNVRQWIIAGVGGHFDVRERQSEFDEQGPMSRAQLWHNLEATMNESKGVFGIITPALLLESRQVQVYTETVLTIIIHVTEHFSYHTGQIAWITKMLTEKPLGFYDGIELE